MKPHLLDKPVSWFVSTEFNIWPLVPVGKPRLGHLGSFDGYFNCSYFIQFFFHCVSLSTLFISPFYVSFYSPSIFSLWEFFISVCATIPLISSVNILFKQWEGEWDFLFFFDIHQTLFLFKNTNLVQIVRSLLFLIFHLLPCLERPCPRSHPSGSCGMLII